MKKILTILTILLLLSGCTNSSEEVVENNEPTQIELTDNPTLFTIKGDLYYDLTKKYDINDYVDVKEGVTIVDDLDTENKTLTITAMKDGKIEKVKLSMEIKNPYPITCHNLIDVYDHKTYALADVELVFIDNETIKCTLVHSDGTVNEWTWKRTDRGYIASDVEAVFTKINDYDFYEQIINDTDNTINYFRCDCELPF